MSARTCVLLSCTALLGTLMSAAAWAETRNGTAASDLLVGAAGNSTLNGGAGVDVLVGENPATDGAPSAQVLLSRTNGAIGNAASGSPQYSPDGTRVVFCSAASNLVANDTNGTIDVFVRDLVTGAVTRVSTAANGAEATGGTNTCNRPSFSSDGTRVVFSSDALGLVPTDTNDDNDVFVKSLVNNSIQRVSVTAANGQLTSDSLDPVFSPDGRSVAFRSYSSKLVPDDTNATADVFLKNLGTGAVTRVSVSSAEVGANGNSYPPVFSPDGRKIAFPSVASNLVAGDTNGNWDIFVRDLVGGTTIRVSTSSTGVQGNGDSFNPAFSPDGKRIAFDSTATNFKTGDTATSDVFLKTLANSATARISESSTGVGGNGASSKPSFSPDGTRVAFASFANNLAPDQGTVQDVFVKNITNRAVTRVSAALRAGVQSRSSFDPVFSPDGTAVAFRSVSNLLPADTNGSGDIYEARLKPGATGNDTIDGGTDRDWLIGGLGGDVLSGGFGNDIVLGGAGNDIITGGPNADLTSGGAGADQFRFLALTDSAGINADYIPDFNGAQGDKIVLTAIDAIAGTAANDAFTYIGATAFSGAKGQLRYAGGLLQGDTNGDKKADLIIRVRAVGAFGAANIAR